MYRMENDEKYSYLSWSFMLSFAFPASKIEGY